MGQDLSISRLETTEKTLPSIDTDAKDDITYLSPSKTSSEAFNEKQIQDFENDLIKCLRANLFSLSKSSSWEEMNNEFTEKFITNLMLNIREQLNKHNDEKKARTIYLSELEESFRRKLKANENFLLPIFEQTFDKDQLTYFAIQSLISILLILIKSAEKNDPTIIHQILSLADQLSQQLPIKSLASTNQLLLKSLEPLIDYISHLSNNSNYSRQTTEILLRFAMAKGSFKDLLVLLTNLIYNTTEIFNVQNLIRQMNKYLSENLLDENFQSIAFDYLKSHQIYPINELNPDRFTGQFISSIILSHVDIENELHPQLITSISSEFHWTTFENLFHLIEQLTSASSSPSFNPTLLHILNICLRLFNNHLKLLSSIKLQSINENQVQIWHDLIFNFLSSNYSEEILREISKALINIINIQSSSSFNTKLSIFYRFIQENKHPILIEQILIELNKSEFLTNWIDCLCKKTEENQTIDVLYSLVDLYFQENTTIESILSSFQLLLFYRLIDQCETKVFDEKLSSLIAQYLNYLFQKYLQSKSVINEQIKSIFLGLSLMTNTDVFLYEAIQPIFLSILPLLADYHLLNLNSESTDFLTCLIGKISQILIIGLPYESLELKYANKLKLPIFTGGCILNQNHVLLQTNLAKFSQLKFVDEHDNNKDFLLSIYSQTDSGAELFSKLRLLTKNKPRVLQKSIEQQANDASACLFAVYLKFYRRINFAKAELNRTEETKPANQLVSLYEHAIRVQSLFATTKGKGGDCDELLKQIQHRSLFLLLSIKESDLIPIENEESEMMKVPKTPLKRAFPFQRQPSHWSKAKHILKLLQHLFQACIRFKKFFLERKEKHDSESLLNRTIENFVYGDFDKTNNEEKQGEIKELKDCLNRQYQRSLVRLITYQFMKIFIEKLEKKEEHLKILLPYLKRSDFNWSYFEHIHASNNQIKHQISDTYYSIIKSIIPFTSHLISLTQHVFSLLNLSYESLDILHISQYEILKSVFQYANSNQENNPMLFHWLQFYALKLCEDIHSEKALLQQEQKTIFENIIFDQIKKIDFKEEMQNSLENLSQTNLQYLVVLLRLMFFHKQVISICSTLNYLEELLKLYTAPSSDVMQILVIKLLRYILPSIPDQSDGITRNQIEKFLIEILNRIDKSELSSAILSELTHLYRTVMSIPSPWQTIATDLVLNSIKSDLNLTTIEKKDKNELKTLLASLDILGGYIESFRLGSVVQVKTNDDISLGIIIELIESEKPYVIQLFQNNQLTTVNIDRIKLIIDVPPPNVSESVLDLFGEFLSIDFSKDSSLLILQLKRRILSVLFCLLNNQKTIEMFMNKPYASVLTKLSQMEIEETTCQKLEDLRMFNKRHLEQYYLSLNQSKIQKEEETNDDSNITINEEKIIVDMVAHWKGTTPDPSIIAALSISVQGWKSCASESEREYFKKGRIGQEEISIVPIPKESVSTEVVQECGIKHRFHGRIAPQYEHTNISFLTFIIDNLQLTEGKWYYCVRLPVAGLVQIGWATNGFAPAGNTGVGDDHYSWSYDGSRGVFFYEQGFYDVFDDLRWKQNDVCGCGIEIDGKNTNIKYWLNGKLLGTAFHHKKTIAATSYECDLLPNGPSTTFYPSISIQWNTDPLKFCELIVSPEDMQNCPLPEGYKPLLLPKYVQTENSIVDYPAHAYLIGENTEEFLLTKRKKSKMNLLRDFVCDQHLSTTFKVEEQFLILLNESNGFLLPMNTQQTPSITISFDYQILSSDEKSDFSLIKFNSIDLSWKKTNEKQTCVIVFLSKEQQIKVYTNDQFQIFDQKEPINLLQLHILPRISAHMRNLAIWEYALPEEQISRLFTYGLFYIANDYQQLKDYRKCVNCISFIENQKEFLNESLLPFDEPFTENLWEKKKEEVDDDEAKYFQTSSTVELFGNKTYLVLNKSNEDWTKYTFILEFSVPQWPTTKERITLITLNSNCEVYLTDHGRISFENHESSSIIQPKEIVRLCLSLHQNYLQICINENLEIDLRVADDRCQISSNHIDFFRESDLTKNTTDENTLRISLKSIMYLNRSISFDQLQSLGLLSPPFEIIGPSLMAIGYKKSWIEKVMKQNAWKDVPKALREQREEFQKFDFQQEQNRYFKLFAKLNLSIKSEDLENLLQSSKFDTNEQIFDFIQRLSPYLNTSSLPNLSPAKLDFHENWFSQLTEDFDIPHHLMDWIRVGMLNMNDENTIYQLGDVFQSSKKKNYKSLAYSPRNLSIKQMSDAQYACEYGLIVTYARQTILRMLETWPNNDLTLFPMEKFGDYSVIKLFNQDKTTNRIDSLIQSILKTELKELLHSSNQISALSNKKSLFNYLQNEIITQSIEFLIKPTLINENNTSFLLKILHIFIKLLSEKTLVTQDQIDSLIAILFPSAMINLIFDLFLLIPIHKVKLSILRILTILTQISPTVLLDKHIQEFFFQFLIELSNNSLSLNEILSPKFQITLADLVYILFVKQKLHFDDIQSKLPETIQNLFTLVEIIDAWRDSTKQKLFPENVLKKANALFEREYHLKQEDFQKSNIHFDHHADQELIHYINETRPSTDSMHELIEKLPTESEPNPTFYKAYVALSLIPADCIQLRAKFLYLFNICLKLALTIVDLSLSPEQTYLTHQILSVKSYIFLTVKSYFFNESLEKTQAIYGSEWTTVSFDTVKASTETETNNENTWFYQAFHQLYPNAQTIFRLGTDQLWHAQFLGMHSTDQGGPYRDSITRICSDICSTRLSLFIPCPNGRMNNGFNRDCWIPNVYPLDKPIDRKIQQQYCFVGQLLGMAIRQKHYLDIKFPPLFWKKLLHEQITVEDIESIDVQSFRLISEMEKNIEQIHPTEVDADIESIFSSIMSELHFDVVSSSGETFELLPGGSEISISAKNVKQYCSKYREYRLNEFNRQIDLIRQGLHSIVPSYYLSLFTSHELEEAVCGKGHIDIELLKRNTSYGSDYNSESPVIQRFWTVMNEMFTDEQKKLFLIFVWGRSTLPTNDNDFHSRFTITQLDVYGTDVDKALPRAHTCFFTIDLPAYTATDIMYERLNYAITCCSSIDGDGTMNDDGNGGMFDMDDDFDFFG